MQISHENESEHDIDIEVVGVGLSNNDWDFRRVVAGAGPRLAAPAKVISRTSFRNSSSTLYWSNL